jgi:transposase
MIGSTRALRVWAYPGPADLRKGFDGLAGLVATQLRQDPLRGDCYLFVNRDRTRAKVLVYDGTGLCIYQKRLEQGRFAALWGRDSACPAVELTMSELALLLEGARIVGRLPLSPPPVGPQAVGAAGNRLQAS